MERSLHLSKLLILFTFISFHTISLGNKNGECLNAISLVDHLRASGPNDNGSLSLFQTTRLSSINDAYLQGTSRKNLDIVRLENNYRIGYLMFDLSNINGSITGIELQLTVNGDNGSGTVAVYKGAHTNWTETNLSSSNKPNEGVLLASINGTHGLGKILKFTLNSSQLSSGKVSLIIKHSNGNDLAFASKENTTASIRPKLVITHNEDQGQGLYGSYQLIDAGTNTSKINLQANNTLLLSEVRNINVQAMAPSSGTKSLKFTHTGHTRTESNAPYALYGDTGGNYAGQDLGVGTLTITIKYYSASSAGGTLLATDQVALSVEDDQTPPPSGTNSLVFVFDAAGNQKMRKPPAENVALKARLIPPEEIVAAEQEMETDEELFENSLAIYPNPTNGNLFMEWNKDYSGLIQDILVTDMGNKAIKVKYSQGNRQAQVDLSRYPDGIYLVGFILHDGQEIIKKIIKK